MNHFDITIAQKKAWSILSRSFTSGRVASTYLFHGREGLGDWSLALEFTSLLNCQAPRTSDELIGLTYPCHECQHCRLITSLNFEGFQVVAPIRSFKKDDDAIDLLNDFLKQKRREPFSLQDRKKPITIPIKHAREAQKKLSLKSTDGIKRVLLFYQMDRMLASSADSLLKLIEEPPPETVIILTASNPGKLLPTIRSRSQEIRLQRITTDQQVAYLHEHYGLTDSRSILLSKLSEGSLGRAVALASMDDDNEMFNHRAAGLTLFETLFTEDGPGFVSELFAKSTLDDRGAAEGMLTLWQSLVRDCSSYALSENDSDLVNIDFIDEIERLSHLFTDPNRISSLIGIFKNTLADLSRNVHISTALVAMSLKLKAAIQEAGNGSIMEINSG